MKRVLVTLFSAICFSICAFMFSACGWMKIINRAQVIGEYELIEYSVTIWVDGKEFASEEASGEEIKEAYEYATLTFYEDGTYSTALKTIDAEEATLTEGVWEIVDGKIKIESESLETQELTWDFGKVTIVGKYDSERMKIHNTHTFQKKLL